MKYTLLVLAVLVWLSAVPTYAEKVTHIVDGDTFDLASGIRIRVWGIDAPDREHSLYREAAKHLSEILASAGSEVELKDCKPDPYSRQACHVVTGGRDVSAQMIEDGFAWDWSKYSGGAYSIPQDKAKKSHNGLWLNNQ